VSEPASLPVCSWSCAKCLSLPLAGTWRFGRILKVENTGRYLVEVTPGRGGKHKPGTSGDNIGKLPPGRMSGTGFCQDELDLILRILYPDAEPARPVPRRGQAEREEPAEAAAVSRPPREPKRLTGPGDTRPGAALKFVPISSYEYPATLERGALVTFQTHNDGLPPAQVRWPAGTMYWVHWKDLVDEVT